MEIALAFFQVIYRRFECFTQIAQAAGICIDRRQESDEQER
jgi:hypothetical protein